MRGLRLSLIDDSIKTPMTEDSGDRILGRTRVSRDYTKALQYYREGLEARQESLDKLGEAGSLDNIGYTYFALKKYQDAVAYCEQSLAIARVTGDKRTQGNALLHLAEIFKEKGDINQAVKLSNQSLELKKIIGDKRREVETLLFLADLQKVTSGNDKVLELLNNAALISDELKMIDLLSKTQFQLSEFYSYLGNYKEAFNHLKLHTSLDKEFHKNAIAQKILNLEVSNKAEAAMKETEAVKLKNEQLTSLNLELETQKGKLVQALAELKATQAQLIQSEKMASLGELTAGIAHEIQNPLNFVNNFSEVNQELLADMKLEMNAGNIPEAIVLAGNIEENERKITQHGKRADGIVKGMLQHSRNNKGEKQFADINAIVEESLNLSFHNQRAKDQTLEVKINTDFEPGIGKTPVIAQDIVRVLVNLFNNAFYAVAEKKRNQPNGYIPDISVATHAGGGSVQIVVRDNGIGIPSRIADKIFQPFFTTKPTGQGTGLGLSLSYDIVKAQGGNIRFQSAEGAYTEFLIELPE
ncbi:MAG TPA: ATP-binding protein [Puia sp.]|nr:ATP-binding protein [Puia sp.]